MAHISLFGYFKYRLPVFGRITKWRVARCWLVMPYEEWLLERTELSTFRREVSCVIFCYKRLTTATCCKRNVYRYLHMYQLEKLSSFEWNVQNEFRGSKCNVKFCGVLCIAVRLIEFPSFIRRQVVQWLRLAVCNAPHSVGTPAPHPRKIFDDGRSPKAAVTLRKAWGEL